MMILGSFQFSINSAAYQDLTRSTEYRWTAQDVFGVLPRLQFTGAGADSVTLEGSIFPEYRGGLGQLDQMRALAGRGRPQRMIDGNGKILGRYVIERVQEKQTIFAAFGVPKRQDFTLQLKRFD
jgi:phage protein U